jgi:hypothetical protein
MTRPADALPRDLDDRLRKAQLAAGAVGVVGVVVGAVGLLVDAAHFFQAYLLAYLLWLALTVGCLALVMLHHLAGGRWGALLLRFWEAGVRLLPAWGVLFLPLLLGLRAIYPWARPEVVAADALLQQKQPYLNVPFFILRAVIYFAVWLLLARVMTRGSRALDEGFDPARYARLRQLSGIGLAVVGVTATFALIDWMMSLEPHWYSSVYPPMVALGAVLGAFAASLVAAGLLSERSPLAEVATPRLWNDLGSLLLTFVLLWTYLAFSQYLIIWYGNLREEVPWYLRRQTGGWEWLVLSLVVFSFVVPFLVLLSRAARRTGRRLAVVAGLVLFMRAVDAAWLIGPAFHASVLGLSWLDLALVAGLGGLWVAGFVWQLRRAPLLPRWDPRVQPQSEASHATA